MRLGRPGGGRDDAGSGKWVVYLVVMVLAFGYFAPGFNGSFSRFDEGIYLLSGQSVLDGRIPYRDFYCIYGPAFSYETAFLFKIFGSSMKVRYAADLLILVFLSGLATRILSRGGPMRYALLALPLILMPLKPSVHQLAHTTVVPLVLLVALIGCVAAHFRRGKAGWLAAAGALNGLLALYRPDWGAYACVPVTLGVVLFAFFGGPQTAGSADGDDRRVITKAAARRGRVAAAAKAALWFGMPLACIFAPVAAVFWAIAPNEIYNCLFVWVARSMPFRSLPWPPLLGGLGDALAGRTQAGPFLAEVQSRLYYYLPLAILAAAVLVVAWRLIRKRPLTPPYAACAVTAGVGLTLGIYAFGRPDLIHVLPMATASFLVLPFLLSLAANRLKVEGRPVRSAVYSGFVLSCVIVVLWPFPSVRPQSFFGLFPPYHMGSSVSPRAQGILFPSEVATDYVEVFTYIWEHTRKDEAIFCGSASHQFVSYNDVIIYYLTRRRCATWFYHFDPGVVTSDEVQRIMASELERQQVRYVILWKKAPDVSPELERKGKWIGSGVLDDYIRSRYSVEKEFLHYQILRRNTADADA